MKRFIPFLFLLSLLFHACKEKDRPAAETKIPAASIDSFLVTDSSWGMITAETDIEALKAIYGVSNIKDVRECGPECMDSIDVTKLYPGQENEATIYWDDTAYHRIIRAVDCWGDKPRWHSAEGMKIGSTLKELLAINGKKISFYGFGWDYGGTVTAYHGGKLDHSAIGYRLGFNEEKMSDPAVYGDVGLDTDMPAIQKILDQVKIEWISFRFKGGAEE